jgi:hypothetical protein
MAPFTNNYDPPLHPRHFKQFWRSDSAKRRIIATVEPLLTVKSKVAENAERLYVALPHGFGGGGPFRARTGDPLIESQELLGFLSKSRMRFSERSDQLEVQAYRPSASED